MDISVKNSSVTGRDGTIAIRDYLPTSRPTGAALLWIHGGGFTSGGLDQHESDAPARAFAARGRWVRTLDYRLAPKTKLRRELDLTPHPNRYPAALHDVLDVADSLRQEGGGDVALGGASAGANLAAAAALSLRDSGGSAPRSLVLAYGTFHAELPDRPEVEAALHGPLAKWAFNPVMTGRMNLNYVGDAALLAPGYAFPGGADLHGLPPTLVLNVRGDRLRRSGDAFADELAVAGVHVDRHEFRTIHGFLGARRLAAHRAALTLIGDWLARQDTTAESNNEKKERNHD